MRLSFRNVCCTTCSKFLILPCLRFLTLVSSPNKEQLDHGSFLHRNCCLRAHTVPNLIQRKLSSMNKVLSRLSHMIEIHSNLERVSKENDIAICNLACIGQCAFILELCSRLQLQFIMCSQETETTEMPRSVKGQLVMIVCSDGFQGTDHRLAKSL